MTLTVSSSPVPEALLLAAILTRMPSRLQAFSSRLLGINGHEDFLQGLGRIASDRGQV